MATQVTQDEIQGTTLGYAQITANITTSSTSVVQATGLSSTVTIPSGGRRVKITAYTWLLSNSSATNNYISIWDGTVGTGTQLSEALIQNASAGGGVSLTALASYVPAAGAKTLNVGFRCSAGTATLNAASTNPAFILVELI